MMIPLAHLLCALLRHNKSLCCDPPRKSSRNIVLSPQKRSISFPPSDPCVQHMDDIWLTFFTAAALLIFNWDMSWPEKIYLFFIFFLSIEFSERHITGAAVSEVGKKSLNLFFAAFLLEPVSGSEKNFNIVFSRTHTKRHSGTNTKNFDMQNCIFRFPCSMSHRISIMIGACTTVE